MKTWARILGPCCWESVESRIQPSKTAPEQAILRGAHAGAGDPCGAGVVLVSNECVHSHHVRGHANI
jgi:hypothetical protein